MHLSGVQEDNVFRFVVHSKQGGKKHPFCFTFCSAVMVKLWSLIVMFPRLCSKAATRWACRGKTHFPSVTLSCKVGVPEGCQGLKDGNPNGATWVNPSTSSASWAPPRTTLWDPVTLDFHVLHAPVLLPTLGPFCVLPLLPGMHFSQLPP